MEENPVCILTQSAISWKRTPSVEGKRKRLQVSHFIILSWIERIGS
jgi:hypothetical protein